MFTETTSSTPNFRLRARFSNDAVSPAIYTQLGGVGNRTIVIPANNSWVNRTVSISFERDPIDWPTPTIRTQLAGYAPLIVDRSKLSSPIRAGYYSIGFTVAPGAIAPPNFRVRVTVSSGHGDSTTGYGGVGYRTIFISDYAPPGQMTSRTVWVDVEQVDNPTVGQSRWVTIATLTQWST